MWFIKLIKFPFKILGLPAKILKVVLAVVLILTFWLVWQAKFSYALVTDNVKVTINDWPLGLDGLKIVQLSDTHFDVNRANTAALDAVNWAAKQNPDFVFLTGDYLNNQASMDLAVSELSKLKAKYGVYAVLGDWDYAKVPSIDTEVLKERLAQAGIKVLINQADMLEIEGQNLWIVGIDTQGFKKDFPSVENALKGVFVEDHKLVLSHTPDVVGLLLKMDVRIDALFSGHTHGGQVCLPFFGPVYTGSIYGTRFASGLFAVKRDDEGLEKVLVNKAGDLFGDQVKSVLGKLTGSVNDIVKKRTPIMLFVSRGLGETGNFGLRFLCNPEVTKFTLVGR